jgi:6,7-dimethyl-8-ribityllumazine synthase
MIKSVHKLIVANDDSAFATLTDFFDKLGLKRGEHWEGERSSGVKFESPSSGLEVGVGRGFPEADLVIQVDSADAVYEAVRRHGVKITSDIADQDWGARMFTVAAPGTDGHDRGSRVAIFSYTTDWREHHTAGDLDAHGRRFGVVVSRFNAFITERLLHGAMDALLRCGATYDSIEVVRVPGGFEIPSAARALAETGRFDAIVCLGCIIRGDTTHYEHIATEVTRGIGQSAQDTGVPHAYGVLTCENLQQAIDRAGLKAGNKGYEAGLAAVEMASLHQKVKHPK